MSDDDPQPEWPDDDPEPAPPDDDLEPAPPDDEPLPDQPIDEPQPEWPDDTPEEEKWVDGQGFSPDEDCGNPEDSSGMDPGENSSRDENPDFNEPDLYEPDLDEPDLNEPDLDEPDPDEPDPIKPDPMDLDESEDVGSDRVRRNWKEAMEIDFLKPGEMGSSGVVKDSCAAGSAGEHVSGDYTNHGEP
nr:hypothetical protein [Candidatus Sigynarchaeota archaeon]